MKNYINKSAKRALSLVLALVMLVGTLFVANVGINIKASAETTQTTGVDLSNAIYFASADPSPIEPTDKDDQGNILIKSAEQLWWVCTSSADQNNGNKYKVADGITAFVLQTKDYAEKIGLANLANADAVKKAFEENADGRINWHKSSASFTADFDGNGVAIYGMYTDGGTTNNTGLFPMIDGKGKGSVTDATDNELKTYNVAVDTVGLDIKNFAVRNSYVTGMRWIAVVIGTANYDLGGRYCSGFAKLSNCEVSNCAVVANYHAETKSGSGIVTGSVGNDPVKMDKLLVYGNKSWYTDKSGNVTENALNYVTKNNKVHTTNDYQTVDSNKTPTANVKYPENSEDIYGSISNSIVIGARLDGVNADKLVNNHTFWDIETLRGNSAMLWADTLDWVNDWFATEGEYPTPIKPDGWKEIAKADSYYSDGTGTKDDPFIIRTIDQLYKMVHEYNVGFNHRTIKNANNGSVWDFYDPYYYKVADDVKALYINNVTDMDSVKALAESGAGREWKLTAPTATGGANTNASNYGFFGNFDGNGVTIYGLISEDGNGFVYRLKGNSAIRNVNFEAAYSKGTTKAAVVTTNLGTWNIINDDCHTIANVNVRNSYVEKKNNVAATYKFTSTDTNYNNSYTEYDGTYINMDAVTLGSETAREQKFYEDSNDAEITAKKLLTKETVTYEHGSAILEYKIDKTAQTSTLVKTTTYYGTTYYTITDHTSKDDDGNPKVTTYYYVFGSDGENLYTANAAGAAGLVSTTDTTGLLSITNCMFDGKTSMLVNSGTCDVNNTAGILSQNSDANNISITNCVSLGYSVWPDQLVADNGNRIHYNRFISGHNFGSFFSNCYTDKADPNSTELTEIYDYLKQMVRISATTTYAKETMPLLDWTNTWALKTEGEGDDAYNYPAVVGSASEKAGLSYKKHIVNSSSAILSAPYKSGTYGKYYDLMGSGTADDPYLIDNAYSLAIAIASGGINLSSDIQKLHYKIVCDIDLQGINWIDQTEIKNRYIYVPFEGVLDGANHMITGLVATDNASAGLVPVLNGGTIKNVHIRNSYAGSVSTNSAGLVAGVVNEGSTIDNCSVEGSEAINSEGVIIGNWYAAAAHSEITNSYIVSGGTATYVLDSDDTFKSASDITDIYSSENLDAAWYKGPDGVVRPISFSKAHAVIDVDGDGITNRTYTIDDVIVLRKNLLDETGYLNIHGDVNEDGETNLRDLVTIRREMVGTRTDFRDGFWRGLETGQVKIYYAENDTYDMARKLQLYLQSNLENIEVVKVAGTAVTDSSIKDKADYAGEKNAIVITKTLGTIADDAATATYDDYTVTYDSENQVLTFDGGCFTAVEQAVLDFIAAKHGENKTNFANGQVLSGSILNLKANVGSYDMDYTFTTDKNADDYKSYRWVDKDSDGVKDEGEIYYYAWGDEFESESKTTYNADKWLMDEYRTEDETKNDDGTYDDSAETGQYKDLESSNVADIPNLWVVNDGRLTINRGIVNGTDNNGDGYDDTYGTGYVPVELEVGKTNDFGSYIDEDDQYVDPGIIKTLGTMLFKYGYAEMRASLPSDGHAFPAWWILTGPGQRSNSGIERTLYDKIYTLNTGDNAWSYDGTTNTMNGSDLSTYKYQIPAAHLEFDIVELMQADASSADTSDYRDYFQATIHKIYTENVFNNKTGDVLTDDILYIPDWSNGTYSSWGTYKSDGGYAETSSEMATTAKNFFMSANKKPYLNNYDSRNYKDLYSYVANPSISWSATRSSVNNGSWISPDYRYSYTFDYTYKFSGTPNASFSASIAKTGLYNGYTYTNSIIDSTQSNYTNTHTMFNDVKYSRSINTTQTGSTSLKNYTVDHKNLQKTYTYGFTWDADPENGTYDLAIYCDLNENGIMEAATEKIFNVNNETGYNTSKFGTDPLLATNVVKSDNTTGTVGQTDADMWNQYAYVLLDNAFYTSTKNAAAAYTTLGVDTKLNDKVSFDIEYIRVYQEDGKRDIVTPETEDFNNGNRYGY